MGKGRYRKKAGAAYDKAIGTQQGMADAGAWAQAAEGSALENLEGSELYQDLYSSGKEAAYSEGGGGFDTSAGFGNFAKQLSLNRNAMTSQFGAYADMGQQATESQGVMRMNMVTQRNRMRQFERGSTMRMVQSIAAGVSGGAGIKGAPGADKGSGVGGKQPPWMDNTNWGNMAGMT